MTYTRTIIEDIPTTAYNLAACDSFIALERAHAGRCIRMRRRGRGPRIHDGRRFFLDLPLDKSQRFTLYTEDASLYAARCPVARFTYRGRRDDGKVVLRFKRDK